MCDMKTIALGLTLLTLPAHAMDAGLSITFATCTGRFSAEMEHAWLLNDARHVEFEHRRQQFIELLDAVVRPGERRDMLDTRIDAKMAHANLLYQVSFSGDQATAARALRRAQSELNYCTGYLLES
jgi:hypothetical protein